jgi:hypothetical protein
VSTLEILIPTFGRPDSAREAVLSALAHEDSRCTVRCNSNGPEPSLESLREFHPRLRYTDFEANRGLLANLEFLLLSSQTRFCLFLSDEDRISPTELPRVLDLLDAFPRSTKVFVCGLYRNDRTEHSPPCDVDLGGQSIDLDTALILDVPPACLSGFGVSGPDAKALPLKRILRRSSGNGYPHVGLARHLLRDGRLQVIDGPLILKGRDVHVGGDGYSHRNGERPVESKNLDLNPNLYGPRARARQFYFLEHQALELRPDVGEFPLLFARLQAFHAMATRVLTAGSVVILDPSVSTREEAGRARAEAIAECEFSGSLIAEAFHLALKLPVRCTEIGLGILFRVLHYLREASVATSFSLPVRELPCDRQEAKVGL